MKTPKEKLDYINQWQKENWSRVLEYKKRWRKKNPQHMQRCRDNWASLNKDRIRRVRNESMKSKLKNNIQFQIQHVTRAKINRWLLKRGFGLGGLPAKIPSIVGCSKQFFRDYIEGLFKTGMTWENHGSNGWHLDHVIPCSQFDLTKHKQLKQCFHYSNVQPLWYPDHIRKHGKVPKK